MKLRPMLQVRDVEASSRWYQSAIGLRSGHGGPEFEMLYDGEEFVLQLHHLDGHEHGILQSGVAGSRGAGVSLWFEAADKAAFEAQVEQARRAGAVIAEEPKWNPLAHHHEATLIDPDDYIVVLNSPFDFTG